MQEGAVVAGGSAAASQDAEKKKLIVAENSMAASMLEMGIVFHSIFVGIDLGINTDVSSARALLIALVFHQVLSHSSCIEENCSR